MRGRLAAFTAVLVLIFVLLVASVFMSRPSGDRDMAGISRLFAMSVLVFAMVLVEMGRRGGGRISGPWAVVLIIASAAACAVSTVALLKPGNPGEEVLGVGMILCVIAAAVTVLVQSRRQRLGLTSRHRP